MSMLCERCQKTELDGRKEKICKKCLKELAVIKEAEDEKNRFARDEISEMVRELVTEEKVRDATMRIRSLPLHQIITRLIAYEMISTHTDVFDDRGNSVLNMIDVFIKASELNDVEVRGTSTVAYAIEDVIVLINNLTKEDMKKKGVETPYSLGHILGS